MFELFIAPTVFGVAAGCAYYAYHRWRESQQNPVVRERPEAMASWEPAPIRSHDFGMWSAPGWRLMRKFHEARKRRAARAERAANPPPKPHFAAVAAQKRAKRRRAARKSRRGNRGK